MSASFRAVQWNGAKLRYDGVLVGAVALYIALFLTLGAWIEQPKTAPEWIDLRIRAFGSCAFVITGISRCRTAGATVQWRQPSHAVSDVQMFPKWLFTPIMRTPLNET